MRDYPSQISQKKNSIQKMKKIFEEKKETKKYIISIKNYLKNENKIKLGMKLWKTSRKC
jgi:hypothetical protein